MIRLVSALVIVLLGLFSCLQSDEDDSSQLIELEKVPVDGGFISGTKGRDGVISIFKGIPYAAPPIEDLRWRAPVPAESWESTRKCESFAASAIQPFPEPFYMWSEEFLIPKSPIDEDCLYLNVWTGATKMDEKRPVVVWIHGGGFTSGSGSVPIYDGEAMAREGVVFININYRLGIFGFFAHPELTEESGTNSSGNYGLMDQIQALKWVKNNVHSFGGDPDNITIAGQSAGSASVAFLIASPMAKGLFHRAIAQSGAGLLARSPEAHGEALVDLEKAEEEGEEVCRQLDIISIAALREISTDQLSEIRYRGHPIIDGHIIPGNVTRRYLEGKQNDVSLLTGWNKDDGVVIDGFETAEMFSDRIHRQWGDLVDSLLHFYPALNDSIAAISQKELQRDIAFGAQNYVLGNILSDQEKDVYMYRFIRDIPSGKYQDFGAFHTGEVPYTYNNLTFMDRPFETADYQLADNMSSYWVNFIKTGIPHAEELPEWPKYNKRTRRIMVFGEAHASGILMDTLRLDFLQRHLMIR